MKGLLILLISFSAISAEQYEVKDQHSELNFFDRYQKIASSKLVGVSNSVDYFFGGIQVDEESNGTFGRLSFTTTTIEGQSTEATPNFRLRVQLPGTKKRLKLVFDDDDEANASSNEVESKTDETTRNEQGFSAAVRYTIDKKKDRSLSAGLGMRIRKDRPINPFIRLRARKSFFEGNWQIRPIQEFLFFSRTGMESRTSLDFDHPINDVLLFRFGNAARWVDDEQDIVTFSSGFYLFQRLSDKAALSYNIRASGDDELEPTFKTYDFYLNYRRLIHSDYLYLDITPGVQLPKEDDFNSRGFLVVSFQAMVGNY
jgi:hypothetical protein